MALTVGSRLGHYEVTAKIGAGGMGQVYQATDSHLGRDVALKVLPDAFADDADRLARFQREAQVLASTRQRGCEMNTPAPGRVYGSASTWVPKNSPIARKISTLCALVKRPCPPPGMVRSLFGTLTPSSAACRRTAWSYGTTRSSSP